MNNAVGPLLFGFICIGVVFLVVAGIISLLIFSQNRSKKNRTVPHNWNAVTARITSATVEEAAPTDDDAFYFPSIEFKYTVENQTYTGKHAIGKPFNFTLKAQQILQNYPVDSDIVVYYNPDNPSETRITAR